MSKLTKKPVIIDSNQPSISQFYGIKDIKKRKPSDDRFKIIEKSFSLYKKDDGSVEPLVVPSEAELQEFNNAKQRDKDLRNKMDTASIEETSEVTKELLENASQLERLKEKAKKSDVLKTIISARNEAQECVQYWKSQDGEEAIQIWSSFHVLLKKANGLLSLYDDIQRTKKRERDEAIAARRKLKRKGANATIVFEDTDTAVDKSSANENDDISTSAEEVVVVEGAEVSVNEIMPAGEKHRDPRAVTPAKKKVPAATSQEGDEEEDEEEEEEEDEEDDPMKNYIPLEKFEEKMAKCAKNATSFKSSAKTKRRYSNVKPAHWEWIDGKIYCILCNSSQGHPRQIVQHANKPTHLDNAKIRDDMNAREDAKKSVTLQPRIRTAMDQAGAGTDVETKEYRKDLIRMAAELDIPLSTATKLEQTNFWKKYGTLKHNAGGQYNLAQRFIPVVHKEDIAFVKELFRKKTKGGKTKIVYGNYAILYDGTPSFAEAEAIMIRFVTHDGEIVDLLVRVALFKNHLKGKQLARHIYDCITKRLGLDLEDWRAAMCDRASTNKGALNLLRKLDACFVCDFYCCSHTLNNTGKAMFNSEYAKFILSFRIAYNKIIKHKGKARRLISRRMGTTVKRGGGVRFFGDFEQITQIVDFGLQSIITHVCPELQQEKASVASTEKLLAEFGGNEKKGELGMAILEGSAIADIARAWCQACYSLEGNDPLIFVAHEVFKRIEESMNDDRELDRVTRNLPLVIALLREAFDFVEQNQTDADKALDDAKKVKKAKEEAVKKLVAEKAAIVNPRSSSGRQTIRTDRSLSAQDLERAADLSTKIADAKADVKNAEKNRSKCNSVLKAAKKSFKDWKEKFPHVAGEEDGPSLEEQLRAHVSNLKRPGKEYYEKQFLDPAGDLYDLRKAAEAAATVLNPLWLKEQSLDDLNEAQEKADLLLHFGFPEFNRNFVANLKEELPDMIRRAKMPYDWNGIKPSVQYVTRLIKRAKRKQFDVNNTVNNMNEDNGDAANEGYDSDDDSVFGAMDGYISGSDSESVSGNNDDDDEDYDYDSESSDDDGGSDNEGEDESITDEGEDNEEKWLQDPGEKARRIWHYWKPIVSVKTSEDDYPYFRKALCLVALVQVSSCAVERVFSQLLQIRRKCKDGMHEDILEVRMLEQCNGDVVLSILANQTMQE